MNAERASRHSGRVAVVSGGANGIGRAIAERLASEGARVATLDRDDGTASGVALALACDLGDPDAVAGALADVTTRLGPPSIAIHCAAFQSLAPFEQLDPADWDRTFRVNVDGAFHLLRGVLPGMRGAGWGRIVLVTSSSYFAPPSGMSHYIASKGALTGLVRGLAAEYGEYGITVNALAPGLTRTGNAMANVPPEHFAAVLARQGVKRSGEPEDQAAAASFLVSDDAAFMTGQTLLVDGGEGHV